MISKNICAEMSEGKGPTETGYFMVSMKRQRDRNNDKGKKLAGPKRKIHMYSDELSINFGFDNLN